MRLLAAMFVTAMIAAASVFLVILAHPGGLPPESPTVMVTDGPLAHATGVHIGKGRILTARHAVEVETDVKMHGIQVRTQSGDFPPITTIHKFDDDVAIIQLAAPLPGVARLECDNPPRRGTPVFHEGYPSVGLLQRYGGTAASDVFHRGDYRTGRMSMAVPTGQLYDVFWAAGSSGGGISVDESYTLVGFVHGMYRRSATSPDSLRIAIPASVVCKYVEQLDSAGR